jgi:hypothetical protein
MSISRFSFVRPVVWFLAVVLVAGCGSSNPTQVQMPVEKTVPVTGVIKYQGKPVADGVVRFQSLDGKIIAQGKTDAAGIFSLSTYGNNDGCPPGTYKVMVAVSGVTEVEPGVLAPEPPGGFKSPIPTKYANFATTDITQQVKAEGKNELLIELK